MRVFVTGATGFIGSAVVKELIYAGHQVTGLSRSDAGAKSLLALGAQVHRGNIEDLECLRAAASKADGVVHTAFFHEITHMSFATRLRAILGGSPSGIMARFMGAAVDTDRRAIETMGKALAGPDRPLVAAFGTMSLKPGHLATEDDAYDPNSAGGPRGATENTMLSLATKGVRSVVLRLPPIVHDLDKQGLATMMIAIARKKGVSAYVGDGHFRWGGVHRLDAARLFRLALENGPAGSKFHGVAEQGIPVRDIAEAIGRRLKLPVVSKSPQEAPKHFSWLAPFLQADNPASSALTQQRLNWHPTHPTTLSDLNAPNQP